MKLSESAVIPIFPEAILFCNELEINNTSILEYIKNTTFFKSTNDNSDCYASEKFNVLNDLKELNDQLILNVSYYLHEILKYKMEYKFVNSWVTKTKPNGFSQKHDHKNTFISGVFYPLADENFKILMYRRRNPFFDIEKTKENDFNCEYHTLNIIRNNTLILFPSDLQHSIVKNLSNNTRYNKKLLLLRFFDSVELFLKEAICISKYYYIKNI